MTEPRPDALQNPTTSPLGPDFPIADPAANGAEFFATAPNGQTFDEYRWSQLVEANRSLTRQVEALTAGYEQHNQRLNAYRDSLFTLIDRVTELERLDLPGAAQALDERLREVEAIVKPAPRPRDDLGERIVRLLESAPELRFSAISIDENLGGTGKDISDRCKTLVRNGRIRMHETPGRRPFYQAVEKADNGTTQPA